MYDLSTIKVLNERVSLPTLDDIREYVAKAIESFVGDRPDSKFQKGYLAALVNLAREGLQEDMHASPYCEGEAILAGRDFCRLCDNPAHAARVQALTEA